MEEIDNAVSELRKIEHLVYVTLKYTRTVDIIRDVIKRLIICLDYQIDDILGYLKEKEKIKSVPQTPLQKIKLIEETYLKDKKIKDFVDFYYMLKKAYNSEYKKKEEFRKNVALVTKEVEIGIERLTNLAKQTKGHVEYLKGLMQG